MTIDEVKIKVLPVLKQYRITRAGVFGSVAKGTANERSDVDMLVELDPKYDLLDFIGIKQALESSLEKKVDLVEYRSVKPSLKDNILNSEVLIYAQG